MKRVHGLGQSQHSTALTKGTWDPAECLHGKQSQNILWEKEVTIFNNVLSERGGIHLGTNMSLEGKQEAGILQTLHWIPSTDWNCQGEDALDGNRIINILCIQAKQKLSAIHTDICVCKKKSGSSFHSCLSASSSISQANIFISKSPSR